MPAHAITLYAKWTVNSYEVSFAPNGGTAVAAQTLDYGTLVTEPLDPTRVGHTFAGWFADAALTTAPVRLARVRFANRSSARAWLSCWSVFEPYAVTTWPVSVQRNAATGSGVWAGSVTKSVRPRSH